MKPGNFPKSPVPRRTLVPTEQPENPVTPEALLILYTVINNYILQYRDFAFRTAIYTVALLGGASAWR